MDIKDRIIFVLTQHRNSALDQLAATQAQLAEAQERITELSAPKGDAPQPV